MNALTTLFNRLLVIDRVEKYHAEAAGALDLVKDQRRRRAAAELSHHIMALIADKPFEVDPATGDLRLECSICLMDISQYEQIREQARQEQKALDDNARPYGLDEVYE